LIEKPAITPLVPDVGKVEVVIALPAPELDTIGRRVIVPPTSENTPAQGLVPLISSSPAPPAWVWAGWIADGKPDKVTAAPLAVPVQLEKAWRYTTRPVIE
jgi:hypothetical protein